MGCDVRRLIAVAEAEIGYCEKETWDQLDDMHANAGDENYVKYSRDLAKISFFNSSKKGVAWCSIFTSWCVVQAYGPEAARKLTNQPKRSSGAGCKYARQYYEQAGRLYLSDPQVGDQIFFWPTDRSDPEAVQHTGWVVDVDSRYVYTIEGNTSDGDDVVWNGGEVARKKYKLNNERIAGYGRPNFDEVEPDAGYEHEGEVDTVAQMAKVTSENGKPVNFRQAPNSKAARVQKYPTIAVGEEVEVVTSAGEWSTVRYNGVTGYMMSQFLACGDMESEATDKSVTASRAGEIRAEIMRLVDELVGMAK